MSTSELYQQLISRFVAPELKPHGFKSAGPTFFLRRLANWGLINFQALTLAQGRSMQFTINLAVVSGQLRAFYYPERGADKPAVSEGDFQQRIGLLLPGQRDYWWIIDETTELAQLGPEIRGYMADLAVPTIAAYIGDEGLRELWRSGRSPGLSDALRRQNLAILDRLNGAAT